MKWFIPFLIFVLGSELWARNQYAIFKSSPVTVNYLLGIVITIFYGYIFAHLINKKNAKVTIYLLVILSVIGYLFSYFFLNNSSYNYFTKNLNLTGVLLVSISIYYLYSSFLKDDNQNFLSEPGFWISFGVSFFYIGYSVTLSCYEILRDNNISIFGVKLFNAVPRLLSVILYLSLSISFILCKKQMKVSY